MISDKYAPRVYQLEAASYDATFKEILTTLLTKSLSPSLSFVETLRPEIHLFIDYIYYRYTVAINQQLPSHQIENLALVNTKHMPLHSKQKLLYFIFFVLGPYLHKRTKLDERAPNFSKTLEILLRIAQLFYFIIFLTKKRQIPYDIFLWLSGISIIQPKAGITRELDFEILNRTLIWDTLAGVLKFVLSSQVMKSLGNLFLLSSVWGTLSMAEEKGCLVCKEAICTMPVKVNPCQHTYCYYCFTNSDLKQCPRCKQLIESHILI